MKAAPVIPVLLINAITKAHRTAENRVIAGYPVLEATLRTSCAFEAIQEMKRVPEAIVGSGAGTNKAELIATIQKDAEFIVFLSLADSVGRAAIEQNIPYLPGVANAGDIILGLDLGFIHFKFFPAEANRGIPALKALAASFH